MGRVYVLGLSFARFMVYLYIAFALLVGKSLETHIKSTATTRDVSDYIEFETTGYIHHETNVYEKQYFVDNWVSRANENQNYAEYGFQFDTTDSGYSNTVEYDNVIDSVKKTHTAKKQPGIKFTEAQTSKRHDSRRTYNTHKATSTSRKTAANSETAAPSSLESFADISHVTSKTIQHSRSTPDSIQLVTGNTFETIDKVTTHKDYSLPTFSNEYLASKAAHFTKFPFITQSLSITKQRDIIVSPSTVRSHAPTLVSEAENGAIHQYKAEFSQMTPDSSKNTVADNSIDRSIANKQNTELVHSADATNEDPRTVFIDSGSEMIDQETLLGQTNTDTTNTMLFVDTYDSASPLVTIVNEQQQPGARNFNLIYNVVQPEDNIPVQSTQSLSANEHVPDSDNNTFDPAKLIWLPNGNWTPSCKHVSKGRYCLNADGEGKRVIECYGENVGFEYSCGKDMLCYSASPFDVDCQK